MLYVLFPLIVCCHGFLLEGKTQPPPTSAPAMSDKHYNMLLDLLMEERQYRRQLEQEVTKLKQEMLMTEREVTNKYQMLIKCNGTIEKQYLNLQNSTTGLQNELVLIKTNYDVLKQDYITLKQSHNVLEAHTNEIDNKLSVQNEINDTTYSKTEIQERLENISISQEKKLNDLSTQFNENLTSMKQKLDNITVSLNMKGIDLSPRVAVAACTTSDHLQKDSVIPFNYIYHSYGIKDLSSFKNTGIFTCEHEGLYLFTVNLVEEGSGDYFNILMNDSVIRACFASRDTNWQESTCTTVIQLNLNDRVGVKAMSDIKTTYRYTCITVVKLN